MKGQQESRAAQPLTELCLWDPLPSLQLASLLCVMPVVTASRQQHPPKEGFHAGCQLRVRKVNLQGRLHSFSDQFLLRIVCAFC